MKKNRVNILLIITVVIICLCCDSLLIIYYFYKNQKLYSLETPMDIANEYMCPRYDRYWEMLDGVFYAGKEDNSRRIADYEVYEVGKAMDDVGRSYFSKVISKNGMYIYCETRIEGFQIIEISSWYCFWDDVYVNVKFYDGDKGYWESREFKVEYDDGEYIVNEVILGENEFKENEFWYIPNKSGLEEATGMTIEEILEIVEQQKKDCENMLYEMKEAELKSNKVVLFLGLGLVNGIGVWLIIWKGSKEKAGEGYDERE